MVEFEIRGDLATIQNSIVDANFDELKAWLDAELDAYRTMVVTPDAISDAKSVRANIRKIASRIDEQRKAVKKAYSVPLNQFEAKCKQLTGICTEVANQIDAQVKAYEEQARAEKEARLKTYYCQLLDVSEARKICPWEMFLEPRWLNASYSESGALKDIEDKAKSIQSDINVINSMGEEFKIPLLNYYEKSGFDLSFTMGKLEQWRKEKAEEEAKKAEDAKKTEETAKPTTTVTYGDNAVIKDVEYITVEFAVKCTKEQLADLKFFLKTHNIKYGPVRR